MFRREKFSDADLLGMPSARSGFQKKFEDGGIELKKRAGGKRQNYFS